MKLTGLLLLSFPTLAFAQGEWRTLDEATEIAYAQSAGPAHVTANASVWVLRGAEYELAVAGESEVHCMVSRSQPRSLEPICYDAEAAATIMRIEIARNELRFAGNSSEEIDAEIGKRIWAGDLDLPTRPAMSYMMSEHQDLYDPETGNHAGNWLPHLMLYVPYLTAEELGLYGPPSPAAAMVFESGKPEAHIVIPVREFITAR